MDARGKFEEHERSVRVARGVAESNSSFLSALQSSQVCHVFKQYKVQTHSADLFSHASVKKVEEVKMEVIENCVRA